MANESIQRVRDYMSRNVLGIPPQLSVSEALEMAHENRVTHLPVILRGRAVGMICTCDLDDAPLSAEVSSIAHAPALEIASTASLTEAAQFMRKTAIGSLLVESDGELVGILTRTDLERAGLADREFRESACLGCGSFQHVHPDAHGAWWCANCRAHRGPARNGDEIGNGD